MRLSSFTLPALVAQLAASLPTPQDIDLDMVAAMPDPSYSQAIGVTAQIVTYASTAIAAQITEAVSSVNVDISDVLSGTAVVKRHAKRTACAPMPTGATGVPSNAVSADSPVAFTNAAYFASEASAAPTPSAYAQTFRNKQASNNAYGYLGFMTMDTYDVTACAAKCENIPSCISFNIYFERDPSLEPGSTSCTNPPSVTQIKCAWWGGPIDSSNAVNTGQTTSSFVYVIAGSNGYVSKKLVTPSGFQNGVPFVDKAINAPYDAQGYNTFMGSTIFTAATWSVQSCADYCTKQTEYNTQHPAKDGTPPKVCKFFNTYVLTAYKEDGTVQPQGQYCALYTETWGQSYATNSGQWRGTDQYKVSYSFGYSALASSSDIDPTVGDPDGAAYQAKADILWSSLQPFCSTLLGYTAPISTVTPLTTFTPVVTSTFLTTTTAAANAKRAAASSTPAGLTKYKEPVLSSACSMVVSEATVTSFTTAATSTITASTTSTTVVTSVSVVVPTPTVTNFQLVAVGDK